MKGLRVSVSEAARLVERSRRTIQRGIAAGAIAKYGQLVDLEEVQHYVKSPMVDGGQREESVPVHLRVERFLRACGFDPKAVIGLYLRARQAGADIDFLAYCIERLRDEDEGFVALVMGRVVDNRLMDELVVFAAKRLAGLACTANAVEVPDVAFDELWSGVAISCLDARIDVEPVICYDRTHDRAELLLAPCWCRGTLYALTYERDPATGRLNGVLSGDAEKAPPGLLPVRGGKYSILRQPRIVDKDTVNRILTKVSRKVAAMMGSEARPLQEGVAGHQALLATLADRQLIRLPRVRAAEEMAVVCAMFELTDTEVRVLIRAWTALVGDMLDRATVMYEEGRGEFEEKSAGEREATREEEGGARVVEDGARRYLFDTIPDTDKDGAGEGAASVGVGDDEGMDDEPEFSDDRTETADDNTSPPASTESGETQSNSHHRHEMVCGHIIRPLELAAIFDVSRQTASRWLKNWKRDRHARRLAQRALSSRRADAT